MIHVFGRHLARSVLVVQPRNILNAFGQRMPMQTKVSAYRVRRNIHILRMEMRL